MGQYENREPLYIIIFRDSKAEQHLREWAKQNQIDQKHVDRDRIRLYNHHTWERFRNTWNQPWSRTLIWDCWNRRHIDLY